MDHSEANRPRLPVLIAPDVLPALEDPARAVLDGAPGAAPSDRQLQLTRVAMRVSVLIVARDRGKRSDRPSSRLAEAAQSRKRPARLRRLSLPGQSEVLTEGEQLHPASGDAPQATRQQQETPVADSPSNRGCNP